MTGHFLGLVSGADESILRVTAPNGLRFELGEIGEITRLMSKLDGMRRDTARRLLFVEYGVLRPDAPLVVLRGEFEVPEVRATSGAPSWPFGKGGGEYVRAFNSLHRLFPLLRLFQPSSVNLRLHFEYTSSLGRIRPVGSGTWGLPYYGPPFSITPQDVPRLQALLTDIPTPFGRARLDAAFQLFQWSLQSLQPGMAYVLASMGLDALVGDEGRNARRNMAVGTAALLARDATEYVALRREVATIVYEMRSAILHIPDARRAGGAEVARVRRLLSDAIVAAYRIPGDAEALNREISARAVALGEPPASEVDRYDRNGGTDPTSRVGG